MKKASKVLSVVLALCIMLIGVLPIAGIAAEEKVKIYAADGRSVLVDASLVEAYKVVGWHDYPVAMMYAMDGRTIVVAKSDVEAYKAVGWFLVEKVTMYAADGRTIQVMSYEVEAYKAVGWYDYPVATMYAMDGRTIAIPKSEVEAYKAVGWYDSPTITMYAADGRTMDVLMPQINAYRAVGWYTEDEFFYSRDGFSERIPRFDIVTGCAFAKKEPWPWAPMQSELESERYVYYADNDAAILYRETLSNLGWQYDSYRKATEWQWRNNSLREVTLSTLTTYKKNSLTINITCSLVYNTVTISYRERK